MSHEEDPGSSQQSSADVPWPANVTSCLSETQSLFIVDQHENDEIGSVYTDVEAGLTAGNDARRKELDTTRDKLRGM